MTVLTRMSIAPLEPPTIGLELRRELDYVLEQPLDYVPTWQAGAEAIADRLRIGLAPATRAMADQWLAMLAGVVANAPTEPTKIDAQCGAVWFLCREFPAGVWSEASLIAYCDRSPFWPAPADMRQFMRERAELLAREIAGLDRIAKAPRSHPIARGSSAHLEKILASGKSTVLKEPTEPCPRDPAEVVANLTQTFKSEQAEKPPEKPHSLDDMRKVFGEEAFATDLLAARRKAFGQQ
jgi:hypothetical protein